MKRTSSEKGCLPVYMQMKYKEDKGQNDSYSVLLGQKICALDIRSRKDKLRKTLAGGEVQAME